MNNYDFESNFIIITGKVAYIDEYDDNSYEIMICSGDEFSPSAFVVEIDSKLFDEVLYAAKGDKITIIGYPRTDVRSRITIYPDVIVIEGKKKEDKKIYIPKDDDFDDEEYVQEGLELRFNMIKRLLSE